MTDQPPNFGPCCACEQSGPTVRNIAMLPFRSPTPGRGWGCLICDLPPDGAYVVVCDACRAAGRIPTLACAGWPADGRVPAASLTEPFNHDAQRHALEDAFHG